MSSAPKRSILSITVLSTIVGIAAMAIPVALGATGAHAATASSIPASCNVQTISQGSTGALVKAWQWRLHSARVALNGDFDAATVMMTKYYQATHGLPATGVVDYATWARIGSYPGCMSSNTLPAAQTVTRYVATADAYANVRSAPSYAATIVSHVAAHSRVTGTIAGDWIHTSAGYINQGTLVTTSDPAALNGKLPISSLCKVPLDWNADHSFAPGYTATTQRYFNCQALVGLTQLENGYKAHFGTWATIDLTYRSFAEQQYWYNLLGYPTAAIPGTSNHGLGIALDFEQDNSTDTFSWGQPGYQWLQSNGPRYGFNDPFAYGTLDESYHHNFVG